MRAAFAVWRASPAASPPRNSYTRRGHDDGDAVGAEEAEGLDVVGDRVLPTRSCAGPICCSARTRVTMETTTASHDDNTMPRIGNIDHVGGDDERDVDQIRQLELQQRQRRGEDDEDGDEDRSRRRRARAGWPRSDRGAATSPTASRISPARP